MTTAATAAAATAATTTEMTWAQVLAIAKNRASIYAPTVQSSIWSSPAELANTALETLENEGLMNGITQNELWASALSVAETAAKAAYEVADLFPDEDAMQAATYDALRAWLESATA